MGLLSKINLPIIWVLLGSVILFGYMKIDNLSIKLDSAEKEQKTLQGELDSVREYMEDTVTTITKNLNEQSTISKRLDMRYKNNMEELDRLSTMFRQSKSGEKRDLEKLADAKPVLIQRRVNDAVKEVGTKIENATNIDHTDSTD